MKIKKVEAREILDSRGNPTVECQLALEDGSKTKASVPSGASTGAHEAYELRDGGARYGGKGVLLACKNVNEVLGPKLLGLDVGDQEAIDATMLELDGTQNKSRLGANAILAVSIAAIRAAAHASGKQLYETIAGKAEVKGSSVLPLSVLIEGGKHSDSNVDIQEFMVRINDQDIESNLEKLTKVYSALSQVLQDQGKNSNVGFEGAFGPQLDSNRQGLDLLMMAIEKAGLRPKEDVMLSLDLAASELYDEGTGKYLLKSEDIALTSHQMVAYLDELTTTYPIFSIEDGLAEDDWDAWHELNERVGSKTLLVGDDLFVTNPQRIERGISGKNANAVLIKPNQIGTVTETLQAIRMTKEAGWEPIISHRSGETNDDFIADLAVGTEAKYLKAGAPSRGERVAKYNRLLAINKLIKSS